MLLATGFQGVSVRRACPCMRPSLWTPLLLLLPCFGYCSLCMCLANLHTAFTLSSLGAPLTVGSWRPFSINTTTLLKVIGHTGHAVRLCLCVSWPSTIEYGFQGTFPVFRNLLRKVILQTLLFSLSKTIFTIRKLLNLLSTIFNNLSGSFKHP